MLGASDRHDARLLQWSPQPAEPYVALSSTLRRGAMPCPRVPSTPVPAHRPAQRAHLGHKAPAGAAPEEMQTQAQPPTERQRPVELARDQPRRIPAVEESAHVYCNRPGANARSYGSPDGRHRIRRSGGAEARADATLPLVGVTLPQLEPRDWSKQCRIPYSWLGAFACKPRCGTATNGRA
jgi:hypothetical protein